MSRKSSRKPQPGDWKALEEALLGAGFSLVPGPHKHRKFRHADGRVAVLAASPAGERAWLNTRAMLRRMGVAA